MSTLDEVKTMQQQGLPEDQIIKSLQERGAPYREISEALAQSKIKAAVEQPALDPKTTAAPPPINSEIPPALEKSPQAPLSNQIAPENQGAIPGMQQSILQPDPNSQATQEYVPTPPGSPSSDYGAYQDPYGYQSYEYQTPGISPDTITEISEQVVAERIGEIRKHIEKVTDFKTTIEAKTEVIEERLKHIEKIIDTLQSSVLRKVGDYVTNVDDIKRELIETQKTFTKLAPELKKHKTHRKKTTHKKSSRKK